MDQALMASADRLDREIRDRVWEVVAALKKSREIRTEADHLWIETMAKTYTAHILAGYTPVSDRIDE